MLRSKCLIVALIAGTAGYGCHGINPFAADLGSTRIGDRIARAPYMSQFSYFGFFEPQAHGTAAAAEAVYFWLPVTTPELGVRFISGETGAVRADARKDIQESGYLEHRKESAWFDPAIELQRCLTALDAIDVGKTCAQWVALGENDDSVELPANAQGKHTNSLVRVSTHQDDPLKALSSGLYRVNIRGAKETVPQGTFLLQLGAPVLLDSVAMARTSEALAHTLAMRTHERLNAAPSDDRAVIETGHAGSLERPDGDVAPEMMPLTPGST